MEVTSLTAEAAMVQMSMGRLKKKKKKRPEGLERERGNEREGGEGEACIWVFSRGLGKQMFPGKKTKIS